MIESTEEEEETRGRSRRQGRSMGRGSPYGSDSPEERGRGGSPRGRDGRQRSSPEWRGEAAYERRRPREVHQPGRRQSPQGSHARRSDLTHRAPTGSYNEAPELGNLRLRGAAGIPRRQRG